MLEFTLGVGQVPSAVCCLLSAVCCMLSDVCRLLSAVRRMLSDFYGLLFAAFFDIYSAA
jgi:hypothetical protein